MPLLPIAASDVTAAIKAGAEGNGIFGGARTSGENSVPFRSAGILSTIVTQSAVARSGSGTFSILRTTRTATPVVPPTPRTLPSGGVGQDDVFLIKTNSAGVTEWTARLSSPTSEFGFGVAVGPSGSVYITGHLRTTATPLIAYNWDGTPFGTTLSNVTAGTTDAFIVKYSGGGFVQWVAKVAAIQDDYAYAITVSPDESIYVTGITGSSRVIFNADGTTLTTSTGFSSDGFVLKYNSSGIAQWIAAIRTFGTEDAGHALATDSLGNLYVGGVGISSTVTITNGNGTTALTLPSDGDRTGVVVKYNPSGTVQWAARQGSAGIVTAYAIAVDSDRNVYVGGRYQTSTLTVYNAGTSGTAFATTLPNSGSDDVFVAKYNESGAVQWCARLESTGIEIAFGMTTDSSGNVYIGGRYASTLTARSSNGVAFATTIAATGSTANSFLAKYNSSGSVQWLTRLNSPAQIIVNGISSDSSGNIYVVGMFETSMTMFSQGGSVAAFTATTASAGNRNAFLAKYNSSGVAQWLLPRGGTTSEAFAVASDSTGTTFQTGAYTGTMAPGTIVA